MSWHHLPTAIQSIHFLIVAFAAATVAWGTFRERPWVPKASLVLAAYIGLPNLGLLTAYMMGLHLADTVAEALPIWLWVVTGVCQLCVLVLALRRMESRAPAA